MKKAKAIVFIFLLMQSAWVSAQKVYRFSLDDALNYAMENNYRLVNSAKDVEAAKQQILEQTAQGLPQINGTVSYKDNVARPVFILPGEFTGRPGQETKVQFGTEYSGSLGAGLNQLIFDGRYFVGLQTARKFLEKVDNEFFKNKIAVKQQVANAYFQVLSAQEASHILDSTLSITGKLRNETENLYQAGFTDDVAVDQLNLLVANLESSRSFSKNQTVVAEAFLKFYLGMSENDSVVLTDDLQTLIVQKEQKNLLSQPFDVGENIDFITLEKQKEIAMLQIKLAKAAYMPSLHAFANIQTQAQRNKWDFFNPKTPWDFSGFFGVSMAIPIFSSGQRQAKLKQAKIAFSQMGVLEKQTKSQLEIQFRTFRNNYANAVLVYNNKLKNRKLAEKIYRKTSEKYVQGMASSLDLLNTHNQLLTAENGYIISSLNLLKAAEQLEDLLIKSKN